MSDSDANGSSRIFISYRREETAYPASWLYDRLSSQFGGAQVFKDVDNIKPGDDFVDTITSAVGSCDVLLAVIGPHWAAATDARGRRRIDDPADFVRLEVETALSRNVRVIPLLVDHAQMPDGAELPKTLAPLVRKHALELSPSRFTRDAEVLVAVLRQVLAEGSTIIRPPPKPELAPSPGPAAPTWAPARPSPAPADSSPRPSSLPARRRVNRRLRRALIGACCLLVVAGLIVYALQHWPAATVAGPPAPTVSSPPAVDLPRSAEPLPDDELIWRRERDRTWNIERIHLDGRLGKVLASGQENHAAVLTPDRRTLLYLKRAGQLGSQVTLRAMSVDGEGDRALFSDQSTTCPILGRPAIRSDGLLALVCHDFADGPGVLSLMSLDGKIIREVQRGYVGHPTFTRDGRSVVYWRAAAPGSQGGPIFKVSLAARSRPMQITDGAEDADPVSSPTSDQIAFRRVVGNGAVIAVVDPSNPRAAPRLVTTDNDDFGPSWSPDGSQIAFRRGPETEADLYVTKLEADGTPPRRVLANHGEYASGPVWTAR
jgi:hypothetical protein